MRTGLPAECGDVSEVYSVSQASLGPPEHPTHPPSVDLQSEPGSDDLSSRGFRRTAFRPPDGLKINPHHDCMLFLRVCKDKSTAQSMLPGQGQKVSGLRH